MHEHPLATTLQVVCQGTVANDLRIRVQSFTCLHEIAANYYNRLPPYMQVRHQVAGCIDIRLHLPDVLMKNTGLWRP